MTWDSVKFQRLVRTEQKKFEMQLFKKYTGLVLPHLWFNATSLRVISKNVVVLENVYVFDSAMWPCESVYDHTDQNQLLYYLPFPWYISTNQFVVFDEDATMLLKFHGMDGIRNWLKRYVPAELFDWDR